MAEFLGISDEELVLKAQEMNIDLSAIGDELDEDLIDELKKRLNLSSGRKEEIHKPSDKPSIKSQKESTPESSEQAGDLGEEELTSREVSDIASKVSKEEKKGLKEVVEPIVKDSETEEEEKEKTQEEEPPEEIQPKKGLLQSVFGFFEDFFFPIFKTPVHRNILIIGAVFSAFIALILASLFQVKTAKEVEIEKKPLETQINIRGGFRGEKDLFQLIWEMHHQGYYSLAYEYAQRFLDEYHDSDLIGDVYFKIADIFYSWDRGSDTQRYKDAREAYEKAIQFSPDDTKVPWAKLQIANTYFKLNVFDSAAHSYRDLIEQYPTYKLLDIAQSRLALCYLKLHQYDRARLEYKKLIEVFPNSSLKRNAYFKLAEIHYRKRELRESIQAYKNYLDLFPDSPKQIEVYFRIAKLYKYLKEYDRAIEYFKKSIGKYPNDTYNEMSLYQIGECYLLIKQYEKARENYKKLIETYPKSDLTQIAYHRLGDTYLKEGNDDEAITLYEQALSSFPNITASRLSEIKLAELYFRKGNYEKAISIFSDILVNDPNYFANDRIVLRIAQIHYKKGNYLESADWYLRLIKEFPASPLVKKAYFSKAKAEVASKFHERAIESYIEFIQKFPDHQRVDLVMYLIGDMYAKLGKYMDAISYWEDLRSKFPLSDYRYMALQKIGEAYKEMSQSDEYIDILQKDYQVKGSPEEIKNSLELKCKETFMQILDNKALERTEEYFNTGKELAYFYYEKNELDSAVEVIHKLLGMYTGHPDLYLLLQLKAKIYYDLNLTDETISAYEDLISLLTYRLSQGEEKKKEVYLMMIADSYFSLGDLFYSQDKISESLYLYLEGLKKLPENKVSGWPLYQIANCYSNLGNYNKANYYYEKLKKEFPDNFWTEYVGWNQERIKWKDSIKKRGVESGL